MCLFKVLLLSSVLTAVVGTDTCPSSAVKYCPPSWQLWGHSCYRFTNESADWDQSKLACQTMGGKMAVPYSWEENKFMTQMAQRENMGYFWIGCNDLAREGTWACEGRMEAKPFFNWGPGQPDNPTNELCLGLKSSLAENGSLHDVTCNSRAAALCTSHYTGTSTSCSYYTQSHHYCLTSDIHEQPLNSCLLDHVIKELVSKSDPWCALACMKEPACRSFNIKHNDHGQKICQLNNATHSDDLPKFQDVGTLCIYAEECVI